MGRVRRYKAIKACDPFSKKQTKHKVDKRHDEPPDLFEKKRKKKQRAMAKREQAMEEDPDLAILNDRSNVFPTDQTKQAAAPSIEPIKQGESLKEFQKRLRDQTRQTLLEEIPKLRKSAIRRKGRMKEVQQQKKAKKEDRLQRRADDEDTSVNIPRRPEASPRPQASAPSTTVAFGERMTAPPNLQDYVAALTKAADKSKAKAALRDASSKGHKMSSAQQRQFV